MIKQGHKILSPPPPLMTNNNNMVARHDGAGPSTITYNEVVAGPSTMSYNEVMTGPSTVTNQLAANPEVSDPSAVSNLEVVAGPSSSKILAVSAAINNIEAAWQKTVEDAGEFTSANLVRVDMDELLDW